MCHFLKLNRRPSKFDVPRFQRSNLRKYVGGLVLEPCPNFENESISRMIASESNANAWSFSFFYII